VSVIINTKNKKGGLIMETALVQTQERELGLAQRGSPSLFLNMQLFNEAKEVAKMLATASMMPDQFRGAPGVSNCMILLNLAQRTEVDPFMLAQNIYIVHNKPGIEAKLAIALFNGGSKIFESPLKYEKTGENPKADDYRCRAYAKELKGGEVVYGEWIDWEMVKAERWDEKTGSKWRTMPGQMFVYRAAMFFIRAYEPGVLLGLRTKDELDDMVVDVTPMAKLPVVEGTGEIKEDVYALENEKTETPDEPKQCADCGTPLDKTGYTEDAEGVVKCLPCSDKPPDPPQGLFTETLFNTLKNSRGDYKKHILANIDTIRDKMTAEQNQVLRDKWYRFAKEGKGGVEEGEFWPLDKPVLTDEDSQDEPQSELGGKEAEASREPLTDPDDAPARVAQGILDRKEKVKEFEQALGHKIKELTPEWKQEGHIMDGVLKSIDEYTRLKAAARDVTVEEFKIGVMANDSFDIYFEGFPGYLRTGEIR
jgi:hypothetical protein